MDYNRAGHVALVEDRLASFDLRTGREAASRIRPRDIAGSCVTMFWRRFRRKHAFEGPCAVTSYLGEEGEMLLRHFGYVIKNMKSFSACIQRLVSHEIQRQIKASMKPAEPAWRCWGVCGMMASSSPRVMRSKLQPVAIWPQARARPLPPVVGLHRVCRGESPTSAPSVAIGWLGAMAATRRCRPPVVFVLPASALR